MRNVEPFFTGFFFVPDLYCHLPDGSGGFVIEADHAVSAEGLYLTFINKSTVCDIHTIRHSPRALVGEILVILYSIGLDCAVFIGESDSHRDHGAVLIVLTYDIYKLLIVSFSHDIPLSPAIYCGFTL